MATNASENDIPKIIKRLELIKNLLLLEEYAAIHDQIIKLRQLELNGAVEQIIADLIHKSYGKAVQAIEAFAGSHRQLVSYVDPKIVALRLEAQVLASELQQLSDEKVELEKVIADFSARHNKELGALILRILRHRKESAKGTPHESEAEKEYNSYSKEYEAEKEKTVMELTEDEREELKRSYRKASKLCHPDVVSDEQKAIAERIFSDLNAAYERNDLPRVKSILEQLENGDFFVSKTATIQEAQLLEIEIQRLRMLIKEVNEQVDAIRNSEAYRTICDIDDWDSYFARTRFVLEKQVGEFEDSQPLRQ